MSLADRIQPQMEERNSDTQKCHFNGTFLTRCPCDTHFNFTAILLNIKADCSRDQQPKSGAWKGPRAGSGGWPGVDAPWPPWAVELGERTVWLVLLHNVSNLCFLFLVYLSSKSASSYPGHTWATAGTSQPSHSSALLPFLHWVTPHCCQICQNEL